MAKRKQLAPVGLGKLPPGKYNDGRGLYLVVSDSGARSWVLRYKIHGKARYMGLGPLDDVGLSRAREVASECRNKLREGIDPLIEKRASLAARRANAVHTFRAVAQAFIDAKSAEWKNSKHRAQWSATLEQYAFPVLGDLSVGEVTTDAVLQVLRPIWTTKPETASRVRGRLEKVLDYAIALHYLPREKPNPARWKGGLKEVLPAPSKVRRVEHFTALDFRDMHSFMVNLREQTGTTARALEFCVLTATRTAEVRKASWQEIDLDRRLWTIPDDRMKAKREHRVPLSDHAVAVLEDVKRLSRKWIFPTPSADKPLSENAMLSLLKRMNVDATTHGFRSAFRDWAAETTNFPREVVEMALAHTIKDKTEAAYRRGDLYEKRAELMRQWATHCDAPNAKGRHLALLRRAE